LTGQFAYLLNPVDDGLESILIAENISCATVSIFIIKVVEVTVIIFVDRIKPARKIARFSIRENL